MGERGEKGTSTWEDLVELGVEVVVEWRLCDELLAWREDDSWQMS